MPRLRKSKMVSFRVSTEEFEALKTLHRVHGHRSVSDLARSAVQRLLESAPPPQSSVEGRVLELSGRMSTLDRQVARLSRLIEEQLKATAIPERPVEDHAF